MHSLWFCFFLDNFEHISFIFRADIIKKKKKYQFIS